MTKKEHEKLQLFCNQITMLREERDQCFNDLQQYSKELKLPVYCAASSNYESIMQYLNDNLELEKTKQEKYRFNATQKIQTYYRLCGQICAIEDLMFNLSKIGF